MAEYYLISQLPSLDGISENMPLPITEERFYELCHRFLNEKAKRELDKITLSPPKEREKSNSPLVDAWTEGEQNLRFALAGLRADKMGKNFDKENKSFPLGLINAARTAVEIESPMEAEKFLNNYRLDFLESLRPMDTFSLDFVFYYAIKLKLILRIRQFDTLSGEKAYRKIYDSIINGAQLEAIQ